MIDEADDFFSECAELINSVGEFSTRNNSR